MTDSKPIRILFIEDDLTTAHLFQQKLEQAGYMVDLATTAQAGLELYQTITYDVVAVDQNLPVQHGLETIRLLSRPGPMPPTIIVTGPGGEKAAVEALEIGASDYIIKDVEGGYLELLTAVVEQVLLQQRLAEEKRQAEAEAKRNAERIKRAKQEWEATVDSLEQLVCLLDNEGRIIRANRTVERWQLASVAEVQGLKLHDLFHPDCNDPGCVIQQRCAQVWTTVIQGRPAQCEFEDPLLGRFFEVQLRPIVETRWQDKASTSFAVMVIEDVTERKNAEAELRDSAERLRILFEFAPDAIYLTDSQGNLVDGNRAAEEMIGYKKAELIGKNILTANLLPPDEMPKAAALLAKNLQGRATGPDELILTRKDGSQIFAEVRTFPIKVKGQALVLGIARDISERKQAQQEQEQLIKELDAFARTVAHDLQTPLARIIGFAELLMVDQADFRPEQVRSYSQLIAQNGRKMSNIIDELLLLAGVRQREVQLDPLDMASLVAEALERLTDLSQTYQAEIVLPEIWPVALGYGPWVEEIWVNYLSNAIKYGGRPPRLELGAAEQEPDMIRFWVKDNGSGLTSDEQARLFAPFVQLGQVQTKGHGLGLSIVRRIVEKLGGQVQVESQAIAGQGCTFSFTLPAFRAS